MVMMRRSLEEFAGLNVLAAMGGNRQVVVATSRVSTSQRQRRAGYGAFSCTRPSFGVNASYSVMSSSRPSGVTRRTPVPNTGCIATTS